MKYNLTQGFFMMTDPGNILARLLEVIRFLSLETDLETRLRAILSAAAELTDSETAALLEYNDASLDFRVKFVPWFNRETDKPAPAIPLNGSVAGWVFLNRASLVVDDAQNDARHSKKMDEVAGVTIHSVLGSPVISNGKPFAVLEVFNKKNGYSNGDMQALEMLAGMTAAVMQNDALEKGILSAKEEARELDRLKNEFIAITSHELRTPLGLILGHSTFLKELLVESYSEQVDAIIRNATRLKEIIESLTSVDNYQTGGALVRPRKVSLARVIDDVCASFSSMAEKKNIDLKKVLQPGRELWVDVDAGKIVIVLSNILKNAVSFTENGGEIVVRGEQHPDYVKVSVKDNGIGIPAKDLPFVFDRFYQVETHLTRRHGGMGLGLSVAKVMVELHGGRIWADSEQGKGSVFSFILPVPNDMPVASSTPAFDG
ncbi:MAG: GAF domain-containing sensor histidine kinase [Anaerolineales bacterium]|nr:GAF domain-containing sensor histidine kinase [Anaerolineales bacterium]